MRAGRIFDANAATRGRPVSPGNTPARRGDISTLRGDAMDLTAFFTMSYGLYVVSSEADGLKAGCIINTATQVTAEPPRMMVAVHKDNVTAGVIAKAGKFAVTAIDKTADMPYIGNFGFRSSNTFDKFEKYGEERTGNGCPYSPQHICAVFSCDLIETVDVGTHYLFIGDVVEAERVSDEEPLTYSYYHSTLKGKTPPKASSYQA
jgi:flavin reductase (DIM6/NTAB) family NADH-FMN oxidoreductase RutF